MACYYASFPRYELKISKNGLKMACYEPSLSCYELTISKKVLQMDGYIPFGPCNCLVFPGSLVIPK